MDSVHGFSYDHEFLEYLTDMDVSGTLFENVVADSAGEIKFMGDAYDGDNGLPHNGTGDLRLHTNGFQVLSYEPGVNPPTPDPMTFASVQELKSRYALSTTAGPRLRNLQVPWAPAVVRVMATVGAPPVNDVSTPTTNVCGRPE